MLQADPAAERPSHRFQSFTASTTLLYRRKRTHLPNAKVSRMKLATFDIEISNIFDLGPGEDLVKYAPFDISVAATHIAGGQEQHWYSKLPDGTPATNLTADDAGRMLEYLETLQTQGHALVAWNGLSFDLRWIGHAAKDMATARRVALQLYDPMFQFFKLKGFPIGLAKAGQGMGIRMSKLMDGADAPKRWMAGEHQAVFDYVMGDVRLTAAIAQAIIDAGEVRWVTQRGSTSSVRMPRLRTIEDCLADPMPDQSWMDTPILESSFAGWLDEA